MATGIGAVASTLMIAGGITGVVSQSVQQTTADGLVSKEVMEELGPTLMGTEIAVALLAAVVSFGGSAVGGLAKLGVKIGDETAEMTTSLASRIADPDGKLDSLAGQSLLHSLKLDMRVSDLTLGAANGATQATHSGFQARAANRQTDVQESRADLTALQDVIKRLKEELSRMLEVFQEITKRIFTMPQAKGETLYSLSSRPAAI